MTVRVDQSTLLLPGIFKRASSLVWPISGIYEAIGSMIKRINGDKIIGLPDRKRPEKKKTTEISHPENGILLQENDAQQKYDDLKKFAEDVESLGGQKIIKDNSDALDTILRHMGDDKARVIKNSILNEAIYLGFDNNMGKQMHNITPYFSKDMAITGPGSVRKHQIQIPSSLIKYLPVSTLIQLDQAFGIEDSGHLVKFITLLQLLWTVGEIILGVGESWSKLVMIIYTFMSVLQTVSLIVLPAQVIAFSLIYDSSKNKNDLEKETGVQDPESQGIEKNTFLHPVSRIVYSSLPPKFQELFSYKNDTPYYIFRNCYPKAENIKEICQELVVKKLRFTPQPIGIWEILVIFGSPAIFLLLGLVADYSKRNTTQQWVITWLLGSFPLTVLRIYVFDMNFLNKKSLFICMTILYIIPGLFLVAMITITGYVTM
ncbi:hypothetical protein J3Q64DRAFT_1718364 [Phycomyces blakesleeanus]|uniref:Uncharacterized protein n=1 Tax=Phycomyces blakesleeanus TaxID=4837 RepID=A0ABR3BAX3_PHYBL